MNYTAKINLAKVDKDKLFVSEKTGAIYLDVVLIETNNNEYGNSHMIVQSTTKEEREQGIKGVILGNAKQLEATTQNEPPPEKKKEVLDDLPF